MRKIFVFLVFSALLSCQKELDAPAPTPPPPPPSGALPTITTSAAASITTTNAVSGGNVSSDGGSPVTERGVCWGVTPNPVVTGNHTVDGSGTGIFVSNINGLTPNTTYYIRAYAKNTQGVAYGNELLFQTTSILPPGDTANLIFVNGLGNTTSRSFITYDASRNKIWEIPNFQSVSFFNKPAYAAGKLYVASFSNMLSLNAPNGTVNWTSTSTSFLVSPQLKNDTLITASNVIAPSVNNALLLIDKNTGNVIWNKVVTDQPAVTPVLSDGKIFSLTVNGTGTNMTLSAYDLVTKNLIWQKLLTTSLFTAVPPDMIVRNDSLIVFTAGFLVHLLNKNTGTLHWTKPVGTFDVHLYKNNLVYNDASSGQVNILSLQTGNTILQSNPVSYTRQPGASYVYNDAFYFNYYDSVFCTSLIDGSLKWRKKYESSLPGYFRKFIAVGNTVYASRLYDVPANDESKLIILNALNFIARDSIIIPKAEFTNFSILSSGGIFY